MLAHGGPVIDTSVPDMTRVYDYYLGGKDNFAADREAAEMLLDPVRGCPGLRTLARENRAFVLGAVSWTARNRGIRQFADLGCGLPAWPSVHDAARSVIGDAAVAYVDKDPLVMSHVAALEAKGAGLAAVHADVRDPGAVLGHPEFRRVIDLGEPVCVIFGGTLSHMSAATARDIVPGYTAGLAAGSAVVISCASFDDEALAARIAGVFGPEADWRNRSREDVASFFGGLVLPHGGVMDVRCWPTCSVGASRSAAVVLGGVGIKG